ncbi:hypothetical protein [Rugosimonospora africana]|uniref:hypothetical protein n=1 Tax=Rugosimonospora africana TaxID=556532 RepID=UPI001941FD40|nr:hypothetical protein [Rugosimonospora africana]
MAGPGGWLWQIAGRRAALWLCRRGHPPFGESERAAGRRLPLLRPAASLALTYCGYGALAAGVAGAGLVAGDRRLLRDLCGISLLASAMGSASLSRQRCSARPPPCPVLHQVLCVPD